jgi:hypothetical protein
MRNLTKFREAAGCRVPFQRVHSAADTPDEFLVCRVPLHMEAGIVDDLEQFRGALKEKRAELCSPIFGQ